MRKTTMLGWAGLALALASSDARAGALEDASAGAFTAFEMALQQDDHGRASGIFDKGNKNGGKGGSKPPVRPPKTSPPPRPAPQPPAAPPPSIPKPPPPAGKKKA